MSPCHIFWLFPCEESTYVNKPQVLLGHETLAQNSTPTPKLHALKLEVTAEVIEYSLGLHHIHG